ncbi:hypothetical protein Pen02_79900 [Plantactinospora endophytica]|uniref:Uncharacterized protein n=1 Tax=Plantactinospora endophytica TaxID=673535 RepID=A0ABQ4EEA7_9ACTN|nr:hypothetical protein Pen02_79900 [Plantactinospora endophytica]
MVRQRTTAGYDVHEGPPKSASSRRTVALDQHTVRGAAPAPASSNTSGVPHGPKPGRCATTAATCSLAPTGPPIHPATSHDTYTSLLPESQRTAAEATARLVLDGDNPARRESTSAVPQPGQEPAESAQQQSTAASTSRSYLCWWPSVTIVG